MAVPAASMAATATVKATTVVAVMSTADIAVMVRTIMVVMMVMR